MLDSNTSDLNGGGLNIQPSGAVVTEQTTVTNNSARSTGGGTYNTGRLSLNGSQVRLNTAFIAAGIASKNTNVILRSTIVRKNTPDNCVPVLCCLN